MTLRWIIDWLVVILVACCPTVTADPLRWVAIGPGPNTRGQVEEIDDLEVEGAVEALAPHPTDTSVLYAGAVNGGLWKTTNAMDAKPNWHQMIDDAESLSIGALEFDPTDTSNQSLVAGIGQFSSYGLGGALTGLLRTTNGGAAWTIIDGHGVLRGLNITGVAPRGNTIIVSAGEAGVLRSTDTGETWTTISGVAITGLPAGRSFDLAGSQLEPLRLFTSAGANGIYRSADAGATWMKVSSSVMDALIDTVGGNIRIATGPNNSVYVAIASSGRLSGLFGSGDGGDTWKALDIPSTVESGGISFGIHPGAQASIHMSVAADPGNANLLYIGGDRQPSLTEGIPHEKVKWPNSIGAMDYSGRLFRIDGSLPTGSQAVPLTHSHTASKSSPHADSRRIRFAANGTLIEADDGGIYRRTNPQSDNGDWFSMNGDIQTTEFHSVEWDANTHTMVGGAQDTGSPQQFLLNNTRWESVSTGDGGVVAVDDRTTPGASTRYSSYYDLQELHRQVYNAAGALQSDTPLGLLLLGRDTGAAALVPKFYSPLELNKIVPTRLIIGGANSVYESMDQGDTISEIGPGIVVNDSGPIAYGSAGNPNALYVGSGNTVFIRMAPSPAQLVASTSYPGTAQIMGIVVDLADPKRAFVVDTADVYRTTNAGATWTKTTGNLPSLNPGTLLSIAFSTSPHYPGVVVSSSVGGVFISPGPTFSKWSRLGVGMPTAMVLHLRYNAADKILVAATLGRGAWTLNLK